MRFKIKKVLCFQYVEIDNCSWQYLFSLFKAPCFILLLLFIVSCEKWNLDQQSFEEVITGDFTADPIPTNGTATGTITGLLDEDFVNLHGHVWSLASDPAPTIENKLGQSELGRSNNTEFVSSISELSPGTSYNYRAYIVGQDNRTSYGAVKSFTTQDLGPQLSINSIDLADPTGVTAKVTSTFANLPVGLTLSTFGVVWGANDQPTIETAQVIAEPGIPVTEATFSIQQNVTLQTGVTYLRPFILVNGKSYYGETQSFAIGNTWVRKPNSGGGPEFGTRGFEIGKKGYIFNNFRKFDTHTWEYDPELEIWTQKADYPVADTKPYGFSIGDKGYFISPWQVEVWEFDPATNMWTPRASYPGKGRAFPASFTIGQKGYYGMGETIDDELLTDFWEYDPATNMWTQKADFNAGGRNLAFSFANDQKGYFGGGENSTGTILNDFWEYDPQTNAWTQKADYGGPLRTGAVTFSIGEKGYVGLGVNFSLFEFYSDIWLYDPSTDSWERKADYPGPGRVFCYAFSIGEKGYIGTGFNNEFTENEEFWEYTPDQ